MTQRSIDINMDVGEGLDNEEDLFPYISSCNIACGGHYGDLQSMTATALKANRFGLKIGVHPSFPDRLGFGRRLLKMSPLELGESLKNQITTFLEVLKDLKIELHHLKLHGALYNLAAKDFETSSLVIDVYKELNLRCIIYTPYKSALFNLAHKEGIRVWSEAFGDRSYNLDGSLESRSKTNAVITNPESVTKQVLQMVRDHTVMTAQGENINIQADTICLHGDTLNAPILVKTLHDQLISNGYEIR